MSSISENSSPSDDKTQKEAADAEENGSGPTENEVTAEESGAKEGDAKEDLREDLFPGTSQDMETEETGGFNSPEALLNMGSECETSVKQELTD